MTIAWPPKPKPAPEPEPVDTTVVGPGGTRYVDCGTVAAIDEHIRKLMFQIGAHAKFPKRLTVFWQDIDALLEARLSLDMEAWLCPSDLPL